MLFAHLGVGIRDTMPKKQLDEHTQRRYEPLALLAYISAYQRCHPHRSPSERRIQKDLAISAPSVVHAILRRLERTGLLTITRYGRGQLSDLRLTDAGQVATQLWQEEQASPNASTSAEHE
jgi:DNA-binding FadR family transcriptional regulator